MKTQQITVIIITYLKLFSCKSTNYYELLGVEKDASKAEIRRAFKKIALEKHPDKNKDDPKAHEVFTKINNAYEVLKDEELRKKYDLYGEEGLKDDHFSNKYQSWSYYNEQFGIYDDDPEIITLSQSDFEQSVSGTEDIWFINFYSPHCSHCHTLAPTWREVARELDGVVRVGAVNCHDDWALCNWEGIQSYPSLKLYPTAEYYYGPHDKEKMISYILTRLDIEVLHITRKMITEEKEVITESELPLLISFCEEDRECVSERTLLKLAAILDNLAVVARADCAEDSYVCKSFAITTSLQFYRVGKVNTKDGKTISSLETQEIVQEVLKLLPQPSEVNDNMFQELRRNISEEKIEPWLLVFQQEQGNTNLELRKLSGLVGDVQIGIVDCTKARDLCRRFHVHKYPTVLLYKRSGYEFHHGRYNAHDIANFIKESVESNVKVLSPEEFNKIGKNEDKWFVDFYAPWCPPCLKLLPEWRKAGKQIGGTVAKFGTVDCTIHMNLCQQHNVRSYPTTIFYNGSQPHVFSGYHKAEDIIAFAEDILHPPVVILTPETFESLVNKKSIGETWLVDFYAPWCGPCLELAPVYRQLAKKLKGDAILGQIDCQQYNYFCSVQSINSYPTVRLYPHQYHGASFYIRHQGWRNLDSLYSWVFQYFPTDVIDLNSYTFYEQVLNSEDTWLVDFYAPWCGHCVTFAPHYAKLAKRLKGKIKCGKINCDQDFSICREVGIRQYPTVKFYAGAFYPGTSQSVYGIDMGSLDIESIHQTSIQLFENHVKEKDNIQQQFEDTEWTGRHDEF